MLPEKVVISKRKSSLLAINMNRFMWLLCREICLAFLLCQQTKKLGKHWLIASFIWFPGFFEIAVVLYLRFWIGSAA